MDPIDTGTAGTDDSGEEAAQTVIMQVQCRHFQALVDQLWDLGVTRLVFPAREYRSERAGNDHKAIYETARLLPRGGDGGFAERFLRDRASNARDT